MSVDGEGALGGRMQFCVFVPGEVGRGQRPVSQHNVNYPDMATTRSFLLEAGESWEPVRQAAFLDLQLCSASPTSCAVSLHLPALWWHFLDQLLTNSFSMNALMGVFCDRET